MACVNACVMPASLTPLILCGAEKGMAKLKQRLSLKKQPSQNLAGQQNPYPMAAGGHHPGSTKASLRQHPPSAAWGSHSTQATPSMSGGAPYQPLEGGNDAAVAAAMAASELSAPGSGQLSEHRSLGQQQEEEAMMELAIKVLLATDSINS